jgi:hypothetical protein
VREEGEKERKLKDMQVVIDFKFRMREREKFGSSDVTPVCPFVCMFRIVEVKGHLKIEGLCHSYVEMFASSCATCLLCFTLLSVAFCS